MENQNEVSFKKRKEIEKDEGVATMLKRRNNTLVRELENKKRKMTREHN